MKKLNIFIVEDDFATAKTYQYKLSLNTGNVVKVFYDKESYLSALNETPDIVFIDYYLNGEDAEEIIDFTLKQYSDLPIIVISAQQDIPIVVKLMKKKIHDYIVKGINVIPRIEEILVELRKNK